MQPITTDAPSSSPAVHDVTQVTCACGRVHTFAGHPDAEQMAEVLEKDGWEFQGIWVCERHKEQPASPTPEQRLAACGWPELYRYKDFVQDDSPTEGAVLATLERVGAWRPLTDWGYSDQTDYNQWLKGCLSAIRGEPVGSYEEAARAKWSAHKMMFPHKAEKEQPPC